VFAEIQAVFAEELMPTSTQWDVGTVGVIDESGVVKVGTESVGVDRIWCGRSIRRSVAKGTACKIYGSTRPPFPHLHAAQSLG
jgi:hypothetical protein